jgi:hypothetical protein
MKLTDIFREHTNFSVCRGNSILLWKDAWHNSIREDDYPHLYSFAIDPNMSVERAGAIASENIYDLSTLPLSTIAQEELNNLQEDLDDIPFNMSNDEWSFN